LLSQSFTDFRERSIERLVIDVRRNPGGKDEFGMLLYSYLSESEFRFYDHILMKTLDPSFSRPTAGNLERWNTELERWKKSVVPNPSGGYLVLRVWHPGLAYQKPNENRYPGTVYVLIDGGCLSTCSDFAAIIHSNRVATLVGEETGGTYYGVNGGTWARLRLRHSKLLIDVPLWAYFNAVSDYPQKTRGVFPQKRIPETIEDLLAGKDAALGFVLQQVH
jgi:C-terminal processing protease CtpA/Prc